MTLRRLAFVPGLLALALADLGHSSVPLLQLSAATWVILVLLLRRASAAGRALVADGLGLLGFAAIVLFYSLQGVVIPFPVSIVMAGLLVVSTLVHAWAAEHDRAERPERDPVPERSPAFAPSRGFAFVAAQLALLLALPATGFPPRVVGYAWLVGGVTTLGLLPLGLLCVPRGRLGWIGTAVALACLEVALVWYCASIEVAMEQGRALPWDEVRVRLGEPGGRRVLLEGLLSLRFLLVTSGVFGGYALLARLFARLAGSTCVLATVRLVAAVAVFGGLLLRQPMVADPDLASGYREVTAAPWSSVHARTVDERPLDRLAAARMRAHLAPPTWEEGPAEPLARLAARYPRRSVVVVLMESQAARLLAGLGEGAYGFSAAEPELARLAGSGVLFSNYFAPGLPTGTALWSVITGLPPPRGGQSPVRRAPEAARLGRMRDFAALGYRNDWLCPTSPRFDDWDRLMTEAGVRWWIDNQEVHGLDRTYWTSWGMPDEQLYEIALKRYLSSSSRGTGYFMGLLTVSNHSPFRLPPGPDGAAFSADHVGGSRYADRAVGRFVDALRTLPEPERPIVFLTADTAQIEGLREREPLGIYSPEGMRIPGLLLLPDDALAGERFDGVFCHEDLLDLLYALVAPPTTAAGLKFGPRHRVVSIGFGGVVTASADALCVEAPRRCFSVDDRWRLRPLTEPARLSRLLGARRQFEEDEAALWAAAPPPP